MHHPQRWNVTTSTVGLINSHIHKNLTQNGESQRYSWECRRRRKVHTQRPKKKDILRDNSRYSTILALLCKLSPTCKLMCYQCNEKTTWCQVSQDSSAAEMVLSFGWRRGGNWNAQRKSLTMCLRKCHIQGPDRSSSKPVTYTEAKTLLHSRYNGDWKKDNGGYRAHLDPIWRLERAQQTTVFRLRTGHCSLSAHLKRIGISDTFLCECGQADQTPDHVLQSCPKHVKRSRDVS